MAKCFVSCFNYLEITSGFVDVQKKKKEPCFFFLLFYIYIFRLSIQFLETKLKPKDHQDDLYLARSLSKFCSYYILQSFHMLDQIQILMFSYSQFHHHHILPSFIINIISSKLLNLFQIINFTDHHILDSLQTLINIKIL